MLGCGVSWPDPAYVEDPFLETYSMYVLASRQPVTEIQHTNIHLCLRKDGNLHLCHQFPHSSLKLMMQSSPEPSGNR